MEGLQALESIRVEKGSSSKNNKIHPFRRHSQANWTDVEDYKLAAAVDENPEKKWTEIAKRMSGRTSRECYQRWKLVLDPELNKNPWTTEEDTLLVKLVGEKGAKNWTDIAASFRGRLGKQCRERWNDKLNPAITRGGWTKKEEDIIRLNQAKLGNQWTKIAEFLPGRNGDSVRKHWHSKLKAKGKRPRLEIVDNNNDDTEQGQEKISNPSTKIMSGPSVAEERSSKRGIDEIRRRYAPFRERGPCDFSRFVLPHLRPSPFANLIFSEPDKDPSH